MQVYWGKRRRICNYVSGIWIPPPIPPWLPINWAVRFPPISANVNKHWKTCAKGNDVIANVISPNQHFASTFSMQIFKFQRRSCKVSRPAAGAPWRACSQARITLTESRKEKKIPGFWNPDDLTWVKTILHNETNLQLWSPQFPQYQY